MSQGLRTERAGWFKTCFSRNFLEFSRQKLCGEADFSLLLL